MTEDFKMEVSNSDEDDFMYGMVRMRAMGEKVAVIVRLPAVAFGDEEFKTQLVVRLSAFAEWLAEEVE